MHALRIAFRQLARHPGFAALAVLTLALGIGANTAIFTVINAVLLDPFPYPESQELVFAGQRRGNDGDGMMPVTYPDYLAWRAQARSVEESAWIGTRVMNLTGTDEPAYLRAAATTASLWPLLQTEPALGRTFGPEDDRPEGERVLVMSHGTWLSRFAGDPGILGRRIALDGRDFTVIGVMPPAFKFWAADVWVPAVAATDAALLQSRVMRADNWFVGRLAPGVSLEQARDELNLISERLAAQHPESNTGVGARAMRLSESVSGAIRPALLMLFAAVAAVLLIACLNVANLLLGRAASREREFGVRVALGAAPVHLYRQTAIETLPIALLGAGLGLLLAHLALRAIFLVLPPSFIPIETELDLRGPVLAFTLGIAVASTLLFGLIGAFGRAARIAPEALRETAGASGGRRSRRVRHALIVAQTALALTLLIGAGLLLRGLAELRRGDLGFDAEKLLVMPIRVPEHRYPTAEQATRFFDDLVTRAQALPGVQAAAATTSAPLLAVYDMPVLLEGRHYPDLASLETSQYALVLGDYFAAQGLPVVAGRGFGAGDDAGAPPVAVLNRAAVRRFFPDKAALGERVMLGVPDNLNRPGLLPPGLDRFQWATIVGVVEDARHFGMRSEPPPMIYLPAAQGWSAPFLRTSMIVMVRTDGDPTALAATLRDLAHDLDPDQPIDRVLPMRAVVEEWLGFSRFSSLLLGAFASLALLLAAIGIYGVIAWHVTQRRREVGIRLALGAEHGDVQRLVIHDGLRVVGAGIALGLVGTVVAARVLRSQFPEFAELDPATLAGVPLLLLAIAAFACWLPARRVTRVQPTLALRAD